MNYEIVILKETAVAGLKTRTNNQAPDMMQKIGTVWYQFFGGAAKEIPNRTGETTYGIYTNYEGDCHGEYDMLACTEVTSLENLPEQFTGMVIPGGKYAKFTFHGDAQKDTGAFWSEIWNTALDRKYTCDFEEYPPCEDSQNAEINIYIAIN